MAAVVFPIRPIRPARPLRPAGPLRPARPIGSLPWPRGAGRRLARAGLLALAAVMAWAVSSLAVGAAGSTTASRAADATPVAATPAASRVYVVRAGDTLWSIARRLQPTGDVRPLVDELAARNGGAAIEAGQRLDLDGLPVR